MNVQKEMEKITGYIECEEENIKNLENQISEERLKTKQIIIPEDNIKFVLDFQDDTLKRLEILKKNEQIRLQDNHYYYLNKDEDTLKQVIIKKEDKEISLYLLFSLFQKLGNKFSFPRRKLS